MLLPYAPIVIGTVTAMLATLLLLMRAPFKGGWLAVMLTRRWVATSAWNSSLTLMLLTAISVGCFAFLASPDAVTHSGASALSGLATTPPAQGMVAELGQAQSAAQEVQSLRAYVEDVSAQPESTLAPSSDQGVAELPTVDTMIAKLVARLDEQPGDVKGWKMLGWSYLNTDQPGAAVQAYETALKIEPGDMETKSALEAAKSALAETGGMSRLAPSSTGVLRK
jgi:hypothetical protein